MGRYNALLCADPVFQRGPDDLCTGTALCVLHFKPLVRGTALIIFAVYILGNLSFTILGREGIYASELPAFGNYRQAFYLDLGLEGTLQMLPEGIGQTLRHIHIGNYTAAREVFLNILLYVPMGYLLPFICKPMRYSIIACTVVGFLCSCATEFAQLHYHLGYFQIDDILMWYNITKIKNYSSTNRTVLI